MFYFLGKNDCYFSVEKKTFFFQIKFSCWYDSKLARSQETGIIDYRNTATGHQFVVYGVAKKLENRYFYIENHRNHTCEDDGDSIIE